MGGAVQGRNGCSWTGKTSCWKYRSLDEPSNNFDKVVILRGGVIHPFLEKVCRMEYLAMISLFISCIAIFLAVIAYLRVGLIDKPLNFLDHLTPDAVLEARRLMRQDLENHLDERCKHIELDLKREMQSLMYKEIADFRKWMSHQAPE